MVKQRSALGLKLLAIFFAFGECRCALTIVLLLFPGSGLDSFWRLNPNARLPLRRKRNCNASAFRLKSTKTKRLAASNISIR
jgi:hypothetical protein